MSGLFEPDDLPGPSIKTITLDDWWLSYPKRRRVSKQACERKWAKLHEADKQSVYTDIVTNARASSDPQWIKDGGEYVCAPLVYLNQGRWADEWEPVVNESRFESDFAKFIANDEPAPRPIVGYDGQGAPIYGD